MPRSTQKSFFVNDNEQAIHTFRAAALRLCLGLRRGSLDITQRPDGTEIRRVRLIIDEGCSNVNAQYLLGVQDTVNQLLL